MDVNVNSTLMSRPLLQAIALSRSFGDFQAIKPLDFVIHPGEIVILTGPNGAGKTTLLNCLSGLLRPSQGNVLVEGHDLYREEVAAKERLAYVLDVPRFYMELTAWEHLRFISLAFAVESDWEARAEGILKEFGLWESRDLYPHHLSRGMRLKLGISLALIRPFKVLLLDEPTSALDPDSAALLREKLLSLRLNGYAVLLSSHDLSLVKALDGIHWR
ncbi:MAG TPA: ABC transporter ATP-binding protein, partial [Anaerolineales bacterium]